MFIHWGPYSLASVEASWPIMRPDPGGISEPDYRALRERFNPVQFDPKEWIRLARDAGQRYMVFTTKHHDGFSMFDSAYTDYKITRTPYQKDIVAMLADAAKQEGMPLGFYYSPPDMNHPAFRDTSKPASANWAGEPARPEWPLYLDYMELQVRELLTRYGDHCCPGDDFFIPCSRLMARQLSPIRRFFDLNCFSPELPSGRPLGYRCRFPTMRGESWPDCFRPSRRSYSAV
jgi:hypothetical protein